MVYMTRDILAKSFHPAIVSRYPKENHSYFHLIDFSQFIFGKGIKVTKFDETN